MLSGASRSAASSSTRAPARSPESRSARPRVSRAEGYDGCWISPARATRIASACSPAFRYSSASCANSRDPGSRSSRRRSSSMRESTTVTKPRGRPALGPAPCQGVRVARPRISLLEDLDRPREFPFAASNPYGLTDTVSVMRPVPGRVDDVRHSVPVGRHDDARLDRTHVGRRGCRSRAFRRRCTRREPRVRSRAARSWSLTRPAPCSADSVSVHRIGQGDELDVEALIRTVPKAAAPRPGPDSHPARD